MKTEWDYTELAEAYLKRPGYADTAINEMMRISGVKKGDKVCDVGAGAAHLTLELAKFGLKVTAVEPNDAMRNNGIKRTKEFSDIVWVEGIGENTGLESNQFKMVTFGSSFNVCNRQEALKESDKILTRGGWFACMWNHRNLDDPLQQEIEAVIKRNIPNYDYGTRREDQVEIIKESGLFKNIDFISGDVVHQIKATDFIEGWKSHGTVHRQSPQIFNKIMKEIRGVVEEKGEELITVPYTTRIWIAQSKK